MFGLTLILPQAPKNLNTSDNSREMLPKRATRIAKLKRIDPDQTAPLIVRQLNENTNTYMSLVMRKHARHKSACAPSEASWSLEILDLEAKEIKLSRQLKIKALIGLHSSTADLCLCFL